MCKGKASYSTIERVGRCFACEGIIKLHSTYNDMPVEELFKDLPPGLRLSTRQTDKEASRIELVTRPLSQTAIAYITSRGIDLEVVHRFGLLEETTYRDGIYLAWPTSAGNYELRATFPTTWEKLTPQGHQKHFTLAKLTPETSTCIVCEGMFSAMAYAQLFNRYDAWYVILNSVSNKAQLIGELPTLTAAGITEVILALDNDKAGVETGMVLAQHCHEAGLHVARDFPEHDGEDWNDALQREPAPVTPELSLEAHVSHNSISNSDVLHEGVSPWMSMPIGQLSCPYTTHSPHGIRWRV